LYKEFTITRVCRADVIDAGFSEAEVAQLDDADMRELASKMAEAYCEHVFWIDLKILAEAILEDKQVCPEHTKP
jgi:hypothetical protein